MGDVAWNDRAVERHDLQVAERNLDVEEADLVEDLWATEPYDPSEEWDYLRDGAA